MKNNTPLELSYKKPFAEQLRDLSLLTDETNLSLSSYGLGDLEENLFEIFAAIPEWVEFLDLSINALWKKPATELIKAFESLPKSIKCIDLSMNDLYRNDELASVIAVIRVPHLILRRNALILVKDSKKLMQNIHSSVTTLDMSENMPFVEEYTCSVLNFGV